MHRQAALPGLLAFSGGLDFSAAKSTPEARRKRPQIEPGCGDPAQAPPTLGPAWAPHQPACAVAEGLRATASCR